MHLATSGGVSEGICSQKSANKGKKFNFSDSSNTVQMETHQSEILKKKTQLTIFLVNIQRTKLKRHKITFKLH